MEIVTTRVNPLRARLHVWRTGDVTDHDMHDIHSLAYTLEDTLQHLIDELRLLHDTVANMHWATEGLKRDAVIDYGEAYLDGIGKIIP